MTSFSTLSLILLGVFATSASLSLAAPTMPQGFLPELPGFPVTLPGKVIQFSHPVTADINGDGRPEILVGGTDGRFYAISSTGQLLWQVRTDEMLNRAGVRNPSDTRIRSAATVADLNGDGRPEIIVSVGEVFQAHQNGGIIVLNADGTTFPGWPQLTNDKGGSGGDLGSPDGYTDGVVSSPAVGDITGDGVPEIIYGSFDHNVYVKRIDGSDLPGWPKFVRDTVWSSPAIVDLDGDGRNEFVIGIDAHRDDFYGDKDGGYVKAFRADGSEVPGWPQHQDDIVWSSPAIADLDGDGRPEVVVGSGNIVARTTGDPLGRNVTAYRGDGTILWRRAANAPVESSPALGDIDGDGELDVVVVADDAQVYAWKGRTGELLWVKRPINIFGAADATKVTSLGDFDGDGVNDVFTTVGGTVAVLRGRDGMLLTGTTNPPGDKPAFYTEQVLNGTPALSDLNGDGKLDLIACSGNADRSHGVCHAWTLPDSSLVASWPTFRGNLKHQGRAVQPRLLASISELDALVVKGTQRSFSVTLVDGSGGPVDWVVETQDPSRLLVVSQAASVVENSTTITIRAPATIGTYRASITLKAQGVPSITVPITLRVVNKIHSVHLPLTRR